MYHETNRPIAGGGGQGGQLTPTLDLRGPLKNRNNASIYCTRALRQLHTFNHADMGQDRLSSLALMHIHYDKEIDMEKVVTAFSNRHPRKMELDHILLH